MLTQNFSEDSNPVTRIGGLALLAFLGLGIWRLMHPATTFAADGLDPDWDNAVAQSQSAHQPTVVLFTADWCPACQALHSDDLSRDDIRHELYAHFTFLTIDLTNPTRSAQQHARKLGVSAIPTLIRYDATGKETDRAHYLDPDSLLTWLRAGE